MTDKQFMEQLEREVQKLPDEEKYVLLGTARGLGMMRMAQPEETAKPEENEKLQAEK